MLQAAAAATPQLIQVIGTPIDHVPEGMMVVDAVLPATATMRPAVHPEAQYHARPPAPAVEIPSATDHGTQMTENARLLTEILDNADAASENPMLMELMVDCQRLVRMVPGLLEATTNEEEIIALLTANDALSSVIERGQTKMPSEPNL